MPQSDEQKRLIAELHGLPSFNALLALFDQEATVTEGLMETANEPAEALRYMRHWQTVRHLGRVLRQHPEMAYQELEVERNRASLESMGMSNLTLADKQTLYSLLGQKLRAKNPPIVGRPPAANPFSDLTL